MDEETYLAIARWWDGFSARFGGQENLLPKPLCRKMSHSRRVMQICGSLAAESRWPAAEQCCGRAVGLLHDCGRFLQFAANASFDDRLLDHGEAGAEQLAREGVLAQAEHEEQHAVLTAVRFHNRKELFIPEAAPARRMLVLIRDADKLDNIATALAAVSAGDYGFFQEAFPGLDLDGGLTPALRQEIRLRNSASYENVRTLPDIGLALLAWAYQLNLPAAAGAALSIEMTARLRPLLPEEPEIARDLQKAEQHLRQAASGDQGRSS